MYKENPQERDLTIPDWVDVPCPKCGESLTKVNANAVIERIWDTVSHGCGYVGRVEYINPVQL